MADDLTPQTRDKKSKNPRVDKLNTAIDDETQKLLTELENASEDIAGMMEVMKDRAMQSTDVQYPLTLARLGELRMETFKQRVNILKTLVTDKGNELASSKKTIETGLNDILSGAAMGLALGATVKSNSLPSVYAPVETINAQDVEVIVETETLNTNNPISSDAITDLLGG